MLSTLNTLPTSTAAEPVTIDWAPVLVTVTVIVATVILNVMIVIRSRRSSQRMLQSARFTDAVTVRRKNRADQSLNAREVGAHRDAAIQLLIEAHRHHPGAGEFIDAATVLRRLPTRPRPENLTGLFDQYDTVVAATLPLIDTATPVSIETVRTARDRVSVAAATLTTDPGLGVTDPDQPFSRVQQVTS